MLDKTLTSKEIMTKPLELYNKLLSFVCRDFNELSAGTALISSLQKYISKNYAKDNIIVISDEMTWQDSDIDRIRHSLIGFNRKEFILINPVPQYGLSPFSKFDNVLRISGLNPKIFEYAYILKNFDTFKQDIMKDLFN